ncbi:MAG: DUF475 domain-containing protein [Patescibacteria group bacterium]|nr:DUF475 domain-containing protein [Patescibacteria group bacterium]
MDFTQAVVIVLGLVLFEIVSSVDNAVVNAEVIGTMSEKARRWFLVYGILIAVFVVRGLLPLLIVYLSNPDLGILNAITATFSSDPHVREIIEAQKPILLVGGGLYLIYLFIYWLFMEKKEYAFFWESHIHRKMSFWFYAVASIALLVVVGLALRVSQAAAFGAVVGSTAFFITNGFKHNAEEQEKQLVGNKHMSDVSKIIYLEILDATFSIDGVLGAFAFTISVPLILVGNGIGAYVVRWFTIHGVETVKKYRYLKNGAMYSIGLLGLIMVAESMNVEAPIWLPTAITFAVVGLFFWLSRRELVAKHVISE